MREMFCRFFIKRFLKARRQALRAGGSFSWSKTIFDWQKLKSYLLLMQQFTY